MVTSGELSVQPSSVLSLHYTGHLQSWHRHEIDTSSLPSRENQRMVEATELFSWQLPPDVWGTCLPAGAVWDSFLGQTDETCFPHLTSSLYTSFQMLCLFWVSKILKLCFHLKLLWHESPQRPSSLKITTPDICRTSTLWIKTQQVPPKRPNPAAVLGAGIWEERFCRAQQWPWSSWCAEQQWRVAEPWGSPGN